jgi:aspartyl/asparaginyl-tRNA synthetase
MKNAFVKVFIDHKSNPVFFDKYCQRLKEAEPASVVYIENSSFNDDAPQNINLSEDTLTTIKNTVNSNQFQIAPEKKNSLETLLSDLYINALNL